MTIIDPYNTPHRKTILIHGLIWILVMRSLHELPNPKHLWPLAADILSCFVIVFHIAWYTPKKPITTWLADLAKLSLWFSVSAGICLSPSRFIPAGPLRPGFWQVIVPAFFIMLVCTTILRLLFDIPLKQCRTFHTPETCKECGYNLAGNTSGICPECGRIIDLVDRIRRTQKNNDEEKP